MVAARAAVIQPVDLLWTTVSNAVYAAGTVAGDLILLPAGDTVWTNEQLTVTKRIQIHGRGTNAVNTTIRRVGAVTTPLIKFQGFTSGTNVYGVSHLILDGTTATATAEGLLGFGLTTAWTSTSSNYNFRAHDIWIRNIQRRGIQVTGRSQGVVDHYTVSANPGATIAQGTTTYGPTQDFVGGLSDDANPEVLTFGDFLGKVFWEDGTYIFTEDGDGGTDNYGNSRATYRFLNFTNTNYMVNHELAMNSSASQVLYYNNTCTIDSSVANVLSHIRSGIVDAYSNTLYTTGADITSPGPRLTMYRASGTNVFGICFAGGVSGGCPGTNSCYYPCTSVTGTNKHDGNLNINPNEMGYPAKDQPGWGPPQTVTATNITQTPYACYFKDNLYHGTNVPVELQAFSPNTTNAGLTGADGVTDIPNPADLIQEGRDYYNQTLRNGGVNIIPPYPHYLVVTAGITPATATLASSATQDFDGTGGTGIYVIFVFVTNASGGSIDATTGLYTAGATPGTDIVRVIDSGGNIADATITVTASSGSGAPVRLRRRSF